MVVIAIEDIANFSESDAVKIRSLTFESLFGEYFERRECAIIELRLSLGSVLSGGYCKRGRVYLNVDGEKPVKIDLGRVPGDYISLQDRRFEFTTN